MKHYLKDKIYDSYEQAEKAALLRASKSKPIVVALYGEYPNIQEVTIEYLGTIGEEDSPDDSSLPSTDDSSQTTK